MNEELPESVRAMIYREVMSRSDVLTGKRLSALRNSMAEIAAEAFSEGVKVERERAAKLAENPGIFSCCRAGCRLADAIRKGEE